MIVFDLIGIGIGLLWLMSGMDTIQRGDTVSFVSRVTGTRISGTVIQHVDYPFGTNSYLVQLNSGVVPVPAREITKECG